MDGQFAVDVVQVRCDCIERQLELVGNFLVAVVDGRTSQGLTFSIGQAGQQGCLLISPMPNRCQHVLRELVGRER